MEQSKVCRNLRCNRMWIMFSEPIANNRAAAALENHGLTWAQWNLSELPVSLVGGFECACESVYLWSNFHIIRPSTILQIGAVKSRLSWESRIPSSLRGNKSDCSSKPG